MLVVEQLPKMHEAQIKFSAQIKMMFDIRQRLNPAPVSAKALLFMNPPLFSGKYLLTAHDVV